MMPVINRDSLQAHGLVAWWPSAKSYGSRRLLDFYATNHGAVVGATWQPDNTMRGALNFVAASSQYVNCGNSSMLNPTSALSLAVWIWPETGISQRWAIGRDEAGGRSYAFGIENAKTYLQINGGATAIGVKVMASASWHLIVATGDAASGWKTYVDGVLDRSVAWVAPNVSSMVTCIGRRSYAGYEGYWAGKIGDARIYRRSLSAGEVAGLYLPETRWELYWRRRHYYYAPSAAVAAGNVGINGRRGSVALPGGVRIEAVR